jgi:hypothetical protein
LQAILNKARELRGEAAALEETVFRDLKTKIAVDLNLHQDIYRLELAIGRCAGKYGTCIYDDMEDPAHDDCLVCHQPYERK